MTRWLPAKTVYLLILAKIAFLVNMKEYCILFLLVYLLWLSDENLKSYLKKDKSINKIKSVIYVHAKIVYLWIHCFSRENYTETSCMFLTKIMYLHIQYFSGNNSTETSCMFLTKIMYLHIQYFSRNNNIETVCIWFLLK